MFSQLKKILVQDKIKNMKGERKDIHLFRLEDRVRNVVQLCAILVAVGRNQLRPTTPSLSGVVLFYLVLCVTPLQGHRFSPKSPLIIFRLLTKTEIRLRR